MYLMMIPRQTATTDQLVCKTASTLEIIYRLGQDRQLRCPRRYVWIGPRDLLLPFQTQLSWQLHPCRQARSPIIGGLSMLRSYH